MSGKQNGFGKTILSPHEGICCKVDGEIVYYLYLKFSRPSVTESLLCIPVVPGA